MQITSTRRVNGPSAASAALAALLLVLFAPCAHAAEKKLNVLFMISDDLGAQALACYGNKQVRTPNIDALAEAGLKFERAYTQFPVCGPSRAALMSGMYAQAIGVTGNGAASRFTQNLGDRPSMSQNFIRNGYYAARVSKIYHMLVPGNITEGVHGPDHAESWNERFSFKAPEWMSRGEHEHLSGEKLKFDPTTHYRLGFGTAFYVVKGSTDGAEQVDVMAANKAIEILDQHGDEPFFLAVGFARPHVPLVAPDSYFDAYPYQRMRLPQQVEGDWDDIPKLGISGTSRQRKLDTVAKKQKTLAAYYACVEFMDAQVGRVVAALDRKGLRDNTIVVFTADHGYHLGEHEFWQKMHLHEESTRIPLIIDVPGKRAGVTKSLAQQIDIYPTLSQLCDLPVPPHVQGRSLAAIFDDLSHKVNREAYCLRGQDHLLRTDRWAYLSYRDGTAELYDMNADPKQFTNLANDPQHAGVVSELRERLAAKLKEIGGE